MHIIILFLIQYARSHPSLVLTTLQPPTFLFTPNFPLHNSLLLPHFHIPSSLFLSALLLIMFSAAMSDHHQQLSHPPPRLPPPPPPFASHLERKWKPHLETAPNCPRCASANTKFCYYNNYSLSQPRYFCKSCRRYWTKGGSLRNVPVGGGCRKSRRAKSSRSSAVSRPTKPDVSTQITDSSSNGSDIDLAAVFARFLNSPPCSEPQALTSSPESVDPLENSEIFFEGLSDLLFDEENQGQEEKQGIPGNYENLPYGLETELGIDEELWPSHQMQEQLEELDSFSCNYNANHFRVSDQFCQVGDNWSSFDFAAVNNVEYF